MSLHLQHQGVAAGGLVRVYQADDVGVLEPHVQVEFLSHPIPPHQLLVHVFDRQRALGASLVVTFDDGKTTPVEKDELLEFMFSFSLHRHGDERTCPVPPPLCSDIQSCLSS